MAAGSTYTPIATTTLGSNQASVTFNSFSGYTDIFLIANFGGTSAGQVSQIQFNGDTGSNYSGTLIRANSGGVGSSRQTNGTFLQVWNNGCDTGITTIMTLNLQNYANTSTYKKIIGSTRSNTWTYAGPDAGVGLWRSTSAITSLTLTLSGSASYITGSTFTLYGITAA